MKQLKTYSIVTIVFGIISIVGIIFSHLALTDIWHGEPNLDMEWKIVQVSFFFIILFHVSTFITLYKLLNFLKGHLLAETQMMGKYSKQ